MASVKNYRKQGGEEWVVDGKLTVNGTIIAPKMARKVVSAVIASADAGDATANEETIAVFGQDVTIEKITFVPDTAQAGQDADTAKLIVRNFGSDNSGDSDVAEFEQVDENDLAERTPQEFDLDDAETSISAGEVLGWRREKASSGVDQPAGVVFIEYTVDH